MEWHGLFKITDLKEVRYCWEHWKTMINWVKMEIEKDSEFGKQKVDKGKMFNAIGHIWMSNDCSLCKLYNTCLECPLYQFGGDCSINKKSPWNKVNNSRTWQSWLNNAKRYMIPALNKAEKLCKDYIFS